MYCIYALYPYYLKSSKSITLYRPPNNFVPRFRSETKPKLGERERERKRYVDEDEKIGDDGEGRSTNMIKLPIIGRRGV